MIALNVLDIKKLMSAFLIGNLLDEYALIEAQITTFCTFSIDGRREALFYEDKNEEAPADSAKPAPPEYVRFGLLRNYCLSIIKGRRTPLYFKFVFFYPKEQLASFVRSASPGTDPDTVSGLCLNLRFDGESLTLTTGTSMKLFTMDRSVDHAWDEAVRQMLVRCGVLVSEV